MTGHKKCKNKKILNTEIIPLNVNEVFDKKFKNIKVALAHITRNIKSN